MATTLKGKIVGSRLRNGRLYLELSFETETETEAPNFTIHFLSPLTLHERLFVGELVDVTITKREGGA